MIPKYPTTTKIIYSLETKNGYVLYRSKSGSVQREGALGVDWNFDGHIRPVAIDSGWFENPENPLAELTALLNDRKLGYWYRAGESEGWQAITPSTARIEILGAQETAEFWKQKMDISKRMGVGENAI